MQQDYKILNIKTLEPVSKRTVVRSLLSKQSEKDLFCEFTDKEVVLHLKSVDFFKLTNQAEELKKDNDDLEKVNFIDSFVSKIDSVRSFGIKGKKRLYVGYSDERKVKNRKEKTVQRKTQVVDPYPITDTELPKRFQNKIICGDSLEVMKSFPDGCVDLILTSPPYNFGLDYASNNDSRKWDSYFENLFKIIDEGIRVLKHGGRFIVDIQPLFSDYVPSHHIISNHFLEKGMLWKGEILWEKNNYNCKYTSWGSWKSPSSPYLKYTWEFIEIFAKGSLKKIGKKENADITDEEFKEWVVAKWVMSPERRMKDFDHPAMFPETLAERAIKLFSFKNDVILDPFNGVGTATFVAKKLCRRYIGIDISDEYCKTAQRRIEGNFR